MSAGVEFLLQVAGKDCSGGWGAEIRAAAVSLRNPALEKMLSDATSLLSLREAGSEEDLLSTQLQVCGARSQVDVADCRLPQTEGRGAAARLLRLPRAFVWRLLKFAFGWLAFKQNAVNEQLVAMLAEEVRLRRRENAELRRRIDELEERMRRSEK